jgi:hypothetical protein
MPGEYKLVIEAKGFRNYEVQRVGVTVGQTARVDANLAVGSETVSIEVAGGDLATVDTQQATVGGVVSTRQIAELPLNGRNYLELARLEPGVEINEGRAFDPTKARYTGISIGGRSGRETRIMIDGVDAVDEHVGTTTLNLSQESIQEFQVSTSSSDASTGPVGHGRRQHYYQARDQCLSRFSLRVWPRFQHGCANQLRSDAARFRSRAVGRQYRRPDRQGQAAVVRQF